MIQFAQFTSSSLRDHQFVLPAELKHWAPLRRFSSHFFLREASRLAWRDAAAAKLRVHLLEASLERPCSGFLGPLAAGKGHFRHKRPLFVVAHRGANEYKWLLFRRPYPRIVGRKISTTEPGTNGRSVDLYLIFSSSDGSAWHCRRRHREIGKD